MKISSWVKLYGIPSALLNAVSSRSPNELNGFEKKALRAMYATNWRVAEPQYDSDILDRVNKIAKDSGVEKQQRVILYESIYPNASCLMFTDTIMISTSLIDLLEKQEHDIDAILAKVYGHKVPHNVTGRAMSDGVIGHEIGHRLQSNKHMIAFFGVITATVVLANAAAGILTRSIGKVKDNAKGFVPWVKRGLTDSPWSTHIVFGLCASAISSVFAFPYSAFRRSQELDADRHEAELLGNPKAGIVGLYLLKEHYGKVRNAQIPATDAGKEAVVIPPRPPETIPAYQKELRKHLSSHPENEERYKQFQDIEARKKLNQPAEGLGV